MTRLHQLDLVVKAVNKSRLVLLFSLALVSLLPALPLTQEVKAALGSEAQNAKNRPDARLCKRISAETLTLRNNASGSLYFPPAPTIVRVVFQGGGGSDYRCPPGASCPQQTLSCPSGWQAVATSPCCAQCCRDGICGQGDCCRSGEGGGGPGEILP